MENISVSFSIFDGTSLKVEISPSLTVGQMKEIILTSPNLKMRPEDARNLVIVFAGIALQDDHTLLVCY